MKYAIATFVVGSLMGYMTGHEVERRRTREFPITDPARACHVVTHHDSDGYSFWSCDKNK